MSLGTIESCEDIDSEYANSSLGVVFGFASVRTTSALVNGKERPFEPFINGGGGGGKGGNRAYFFVYRISLKRVKPSGRMARVYGTADLKLDVGPFWK